MRRAVRIVRKDGSTVDLEICRATKIKAELGMMHLDKLDSGWRLIFTEDVAGDFSQIERFEVVREA